MVTRVSTYFQNQNSLGQLRQSFSNLDQLTYQITTGLKDDKLSGFAGEANKLLDLYNLQENANSYLDNIDTASSRLSATEDALQGLNDLLQDAASLWTIARNETTPETRASLSAEAEALTESFYNILNTQYDGRYVFSGQNGTESPTTATATATAWPGAPAPTTYYIGDSAVPTVITGPGNVTSYGIAGDEDAFAKMKAGLEALWYGISNNSTTDIDSAISAMTEAKDDLSSLVGTVGGQLTTLSQQQTRLENQVTFLQEQIDEIDKVDVTQAITEFSQQEATLEASMSIIVQLNQLTLLNFL